MALARSYKSNTETDMQPETRLEPERRHTAPSGEISRNSKACQDHKDFKNVIRDLRKKGIVTQMGIKQALSKGALNIETFEEEDDKKDAVKNEKEIKKQQMYRRLKAPSLGKAVETMVRNDSDTLHVLTRQDKQTGGTTTDEASSSFRRSQRQGLVKDADGSMNSNIYKLDDPAKKRRSAGSLIHKLGSAFSLASLEEELGDEKR